MFSLFGLHQLPAQALFRVTYLAEHQFQQAEGFNGPNTLVFTTKKSYFTHSQYPATSNSSLTGNVVRVQAGDPEQFPVYTSLPDSLVLGKVRGRPGNANTISILAEPLPAINWTVTDSQRLIGGYPCIRATTTFEGRSYEAWFTPVIAAPFGPYRLRGLPGLILEANSTDGQVSWTFSSLQELSSGSVVIEEPTYGERYEWEDFVQAVIDDKYRRESNSNLDYTITIRDPNPDFFIERGKFSIFERYLDQ